MPCRRPLSCQSATLVSLRSKVEHRGFCCPAVTSSAVVRSPVRSLGIGLQLFRQSLSCRFRFPSICIICKIGVGPSFRSMSVLVAASDLRYATRSDFTHIFKTFQTAMMVAGRPVSRLRPGTTAAWYLVHIMKILIWISGSLQLYRRALRKE